MVKHPRSRPKLRIAVVFLLSLILFSVLFMFACKRCPDKFSAASAGGLRQHQKKCQAFLKREEDANQRRKATATSSKVKRAKLKDRKMRLGSAAPGVSLFMTFNKYHGLLAQLGRDCCRSKYSLSRKHCIPQLGASGDGSRFWCR
jgi:hypothetical protein